MALAKLINECHLNNIPVMAVTAVGRELVTKAAAIEGYSDAKQN
jgi:hypothetical protein